MKGLSLSDISKRLGLKAKGEKKILGYFIDSRETVSQGLFFALPGNRHDGHHFLSEVAQKGAVAAVVSKAYSGPDFGLTLLPVDDVQAALQGLGKSLLEERKLKVAAITGSLGKTTTKDFIWTILSKKFQSAKSPLNRNTQATLPLTLLNLEGNEELLVLEMGMTQKGQIERLSSLAPPDIVLITNVAHVHSEFFPDGLEGIAQAKMEIFSQPKTKIGLIPYDLLRYEKWLQRSSFPKKTFSFEEKKADFFLQREKGKFIVIEKEETSPSFSLPFEERHFIYNALAAIAFARLWGMSYEEIIPSLSELKTPKMRFEKLEKNGILFINDAYNAAPLSMRMALSHLPQPKAGGKRIAVLGEMRELGSISDDSHREIGRYALGFVDLLFCLGERCAWMCKEFQEGGKKAELFLTHEALAQKLKEEIQMNDVVLLKGSRVMEMEKILAFF